MKNIIAIIGTWVSLAICMACGPVTPSPRVQSQVVATALPPAPVTTEVPTQSPEAATEVPAQSPEAATEVPAQSPETAAPYCGLPLNLRKNDWPAKLGETTAEEMRPPAQGSMTLVLLPDTQYYAACSFDHLKKQAEFIQKERRARNIQAVITLGDLTDHNNAQEWGFFKESMKPVPTDLPLVLVLGNHDLGDDGTANHRHTTFPQHFDEAWAKPAGALKEVMTAGSLENAFYSIDMGRFKLGVLALEWSPRKATVEWANRVVKRFRDHRVMVATHAYLYHDSTRYDFARKGTSQEWNPLEYGTAKGDLVSDQGHDGEMLWNALIKRHANIFMVVSGHVLKNGTGHQVSRGDAGNIVHEILVNYQMLNEGGLGYLRLMEISPDGKTVAMKTYSPSLGLFSYAKDQAFEITVEPPLFR